MKTNKSYSELLTYRTYIDRFNYLKLGAKIGAATFGYDRVFNQMFYRSAEWKHIRDRVIVRDNGCDLGIAGREISKGQTIFIHHMNPFSIEDIESRADILLNQEFLITTIFETHNAIHYGDESLLIKEPVVRTRNDTCPWRQ